jgi:hypothetical protein
MNCVCHHCWAAGEIDTETLREEPCPSCGNPALERVEYTPAVDRALAGGGCGHLDRIEWLELARAAIDQSCLYGLDAVDRAIAQVIRLRRSDQSDTEEVERR